MKKVLLIALVIVAAMGIGCRRRVVQTSTWIPQPMVPPQRNTLRSATFKANSQRPLISKTYALDLRNVPQVYQNEIAFYVNNALAHKGMTQDPQSECVVSVALFDTNVGLASLHGVRSRNLSLTINASENRVPCWEVTVSVHGRPLSNANGWLPGMVAVAYMYMGQNRSGMQNAGNISFAVQEISISL